MDDNKYYDSQLCLERLAKWLKRFQESKRREKARDKENRRELDGYYKESNLSLTEKRHIIKDKKERRAEYNREYRQTHKEEIRIYQKAYREENRLEIREYKEQYTTVKKARGVINDSKKEQRKEYQKKYWDTHREEIKKQRAEHYQKHREEIKAAYARKKAEKEASKLAALQEKSI